MGFWLFISAALISLLWLLVHLTAGEREIARPMLGAADLDEVVRETQYLCWHFTSISIACMAGFFLLAAMLDDRGLAVAGTALAAGFAFSGIGLVLTRKKSHLKMPQGWLFVPVAALGLWGLLI